MSVTLAHLLVLVGALLIAAGCQRPLDAAVRSANAAAIALTATHAAIVEQRRLDQIAAARRVVGDRDDPAVRAEQLDRAAEVGRKYRKAWEAYDKARAAWVTVVAAIKTSQLTEGEPLAGVTRLLMVLAECMRELEEIRHEH